MKKIIYLLIAAYYLLLVPMALAQTPTPEGTTATPTSKDQEIKDRIQERIQEVRKAKNTAFWGTLKEITNSTLILDTPRGERRVKTNGETTFVLGKKEIKITDLAIGNFIIAMGTLDQNGTLNAKRILALAKPPAPAKSRQAVYGKVTDISEDEKILVLTHPKKGTIFQVQVTNSTIITKKVDGKIKKVNFSDIEVGDRVVAVGSKEKTDGTLTAKIIHVIPGKATGLEKETLTPTPTKKPTPTPTPAE